MSKQRHQWRGEEEAMIFVIAVLVTVVCYGSLLLPVALPRVLAKTLQRPSLHDEEGIVLYGTHAFPRKDVEDAMLLMGNALTGNEREESEDEAMVGSEGDEVPMAMYPAMERP